MTNLEWLNSLSDDEFISQLELDGCSSDGIIDYILDCDVVVPDCCYSDDTSIAECTKYWLNCSATPYGFDGTVRDYIKTLDSKQFEEFFTHECRAIHMSPCFLDCGNYNKNGKGCPEEFEGYYSREDDEYIQSCEGCLAMWLDDEHSAENDCEHA